MGTTNILDKSSLFNIKPLRCYAQGTDDQDLVSKIKNYFTEELKVNQQFVDRESFDDPDMYYYVSAIGFPIIKKIKKSNLFGKIIEKQYQKINDIIADSEAAEETDTQEEATDTSVNS